MKKEQLPCSEARLWWGPLPSPLFSGQDMKPLTLSPSHSHQWDQMEQRLRTQIQSKILGEGRGWKKEATGWKWPTGYVGEEGRKRKAWDLVNTSTNPVTVGATASQPLSFENCLAYPIIYHFNDYKHNLCFFAKKLTQKNLTFSFSFLIFSKHKTNNF